ncbi:egl nine homolog 1-like isoform X2 [Argopecten irradians]|uniref:egl nine homolog 1-like isoform X2 n=1 Tax=Argopecten irradians TaxID=31199 RepID=UPI003723BD71
MADDAKSVPFVLKCNVCGSSSSLKRCSRCKQVVYCSREHQLKDWSAHKLSCQVTLGQNRPKSNMCEVITLSSCRHAQSTRSINDEIGPTNETPQHPWHQQHNVNEDETSSITNPNEKYNVETSRNVDNNTMCQGNKDVRIKTDKETRFALESNRTKHEDDILCEYTPFDKRPLIERHFGKPKSKNIRNLAMFVMDNLNNNNFCVVDSLFEDHHLDRVLAEIKSLDAKSQLKTGKLAGGRTSDDNNQKELRAEIRSDRMAWVDRNQEDIPQIGRAVERLDSIMTDLNSLFEDKDCFINSRTKVMVTCYPGEGTCYRRHVDNPTKDGRRITCILYLNRDWNVQDIGGKQPCVIFYWRILVTNNHV